MRGTHFARINPETVPELPYGSYLIKSIGVADDVTIANNASSIVRSLVADGMKDRNRLFYYDSEGNIDEITHRDGRHIGFAPGPFREGSTMWTARRTLAGIPARAVVRLKTQGTIRVLDGKPGMTFPVDNAHLNVRHDVVIVHVRDYRYGDGGNAWQIWTMHLGEDCELVDFETTQGVRI